MRYRSATSIVALAFVMSQVPGPQAWSKALSLSATPAHAALSSQPPAHVNYTFAHGAVVRNRTMRLALDIQTQDPGHPYNNGTYKVGLQSKLAQYITYVGNDGSANIESDFSDIATKVNGQPVLNAIPPTHDIYTDHWFRPLLNISPEGVCDCSRMGNLVYDVTKDAAGQSHVHAIPIGDYFTYLHPRLPRSAAEVARGWQGTLPFGYVSSHVVHPQSKLMLNNGAWSIHTTLNQPFSATISVASFLKLFPNSRLASNKPITAAGFLTLDSTLKVNQTDGVNVVPLHAKKGVAGKYCAACSGYPMPLHGVMHFRQSFMQNGTLLYLSDVKGTLDITTGG